MLTNPASEPNVDDTVGGALTSASRVRFHELTIVREPDRDPLVGCARSRRFLEVDETTLTALELLDTAPSIAAAEAELHHRFGEEFDVIQLVELTRDRGFVATIDGDEVDFDAPDAATRHAWLYRLSPRMTWLRHPVCLVAPVALLALVVLLMPTHLWVVPRPMDLHVAVRPVLVPLIAFGALMLTAYVHELAHFFVARSFGIDAIIKVSRRYHIAVLETDVTNAWTLSVRQRLAIFASGSLFNVAVIATACLLQIAAYHGLLPLPDAAFGWVRLVAYVNFLPLMYQLAFFARTDVYFALLVATGQRNLRTDALRFLVWKFVRVARVLRRMPHQPCGAVARRSSATTPTASAAGPRSGWTTQTGIRSRRAIGARSAASPLCSRRSPPSSSAISPSSVSMRKRASSTCSSPPWKARGARATPS